MLWPAHQRFCLLEGDQNGQPAKSPKLSSAVLLRETCRKYENPSSDACPKHRQCDHAEDTPVLKSMPMVLPVLLKRFWLGSATGRATDKPNGIPSAVMVGSVHLSKGLLQPRAVVRTGGVRRGYSSMSPWMPHRKWEVGPYNLECIAVGQRWEMFPLPHNPPSNNGGSASKRRTQPRTVPKEDWEEGTAPHPAG